MKKIFFYVIALAIIVSLITVSGLSGCKQTAAEETTAAAEETTAAAEETTAAAEETTAVDETGIKKPRVPEGNVEFTLAFQPWPGGIKMTEDFIKRFEKKYPNIKVNVNYELSEDKIVAAIGAGTETDLMYFNVASLLKGGADITKLFLPLSPDLMTVDQFYETTYLEEEKRAIGSDGQVYAAMWGTGYFMGGVVYHKDITDAAGIDMTKIKDLDELMEAGKKLTEYDDNGKITRSGFGYIVQMNGLLEDLTIAYGGDPLDEKTGTWNFDTPEGLKAIEFLSRFKESMDPVGTYDWGAAVTNKLCVLSLVGPFVMGLWKDQFPDLKFGYIPIPNVPGMDKYIHTMESWAFLGASKKLTGDKKDAVLLYLYELLTNPDDSYRPAMAPENEWWIGLAGNKNVYKSIKADIDNGKAVTPWEQWYIDIWDTRHFEPINTRLDLLPWQIEPDPFLLKMWAGEMTPKDAAIAIGNRFTELEKQLMDSGSPTPQ